MVITDKYISFHGDFNVSTTSATSTNDVYTYRLYGDEESSWVVYNNKKYWVGTGTASSTTDYRFIKTCGWDDWELYEWDRHRCSNNKLPLDPKDRLKRIIASRQAPSIRTSRKHLRLDVDEREMRARQTLRRVVGEDNFRNFLTNGFVTVRAKSGKSYQIFPGYDMTCVFEKGRMVERLCVVLSGNFPPTDSVIMRYLMILNNEKQFKELAIAHKVYERKNEVVVPDNRPLTEIYKELKVA